MSEPRPTIEDEQREWATRNCKAHSDPIRLPSCLHCAEDEKILEERIGAVVHAVARFVQPDGPSRRESETELTDALRSLVREVRRG